MRPYYFYMEEKKSDNKNKIPEKMARLAWPKAKYGLLVAIILFLAVNFLLYKNQILSFFN